MYIKNQALNLLNLKLNIIIVSKLSSEIIERYIFILKYSPILDLQEIRDVIYDKFPALYLSDDYKIFWQYSKTEFMEVHDTITYLAAITCMASNTFYILLDDFEDVWEDNLTFLLDLDRIEEEERKERERDIYDVKILRPSDEGVETAESSKLSMPKVIRRIRTESEILSYAIRNEPPAFCYTNDALMGYTLISDMQKGYPKVKVKLRIIPDIEFVKRVGKDSKGKKGKGKAAAGKTKKKKK